MTDWKALEDAGDHAYFMAELDEVTQTRLIDDLATDGPRSREWWYEVLVDGPRHRDFPTLSDGPRRRR